MKASLHFLIIRILYALTLTFLDLALMGLPENSPIYSWLIRIQSCLRLHPLSLSQPVPSLTATARYSPITAYQNSLYPECRPVLFYSI
ncbi:unnamed protein product [Hymenolepis diminuta]|uniref:Uncharacterized protein n=1 Tax=Hymenolepis diminuta TaxID=6216 RepID=A0A564ZCU3_HYMDI|nr:unnamed protein product [Hymenolepis diminuta]